MPNFKTYILYACCVILCYSCRKETADLQPQTVAVPTNLDLRDIVFCAPDTGYIFGGSRFFHGIRLTTVDGGNTWHIDSMGHTGVYSGAFATPHIGGAIGQNGAFYGTTDGGKMWQTYGNENGKLMQGIAAQSNGSFIAVGGVSYRTGVRVAYNNLGNVTMQDTTTHELTDVAFSAFNTATAVGYGAVYRTTNAGNTWQQQDVSGDFFKAVQFITPEVGYIVGFAGSIWKTTDGGSSWQCLRNGNEIGIDGEFTNVCFATATHGYICGTHGLLWETTDGAKTWREVRNLPNITFHTLYLQGEKGWVAGANGTLIRF